MTKQGGRAAHVVCPFCACRIRNSDARAHFLSLACSEGAQRVRATADTDAPDFDADARSQSPRRADDACAKVVMGAGRLPSGERDWAAAQSVAEPCGAIRLHRTTRRRSVILHTDASSMPPPAAGSLSSPPSDSLSAPAAKWGYFGSIKRLGRLFGARNGRHLSSN